MDKIELKRRVMEISNDLPVNYCELICKAYPEYDNKQGINKIRNVRSLAAYDEKITTLLESLAKKYKKMVSTFSSKPMPTNKGKKLVSQ